MSMSTLGLYEEYLGFRFGVISLSRNGQGSKYIALKNVIVKRAISFNWLAGLLYE